MRNTRSNQRTRSTPGSVGRSFNSRVSFHVDTCFGEYLLDPITVDICIRNPKLVCFAESLQSRRGCEVFPVLDAEVDVFEIKEVAIQKFRVAVIVLDISLAVKHSVDWSSDGQTASSVKCEFPTGAKGSEGLFCAT